MNGRIYDPQLGRMASADPILQDPLNSQNFNRYSYVINNPLKYTDPTGFYGCGLSDNCGFHTISICYACINPGPCSLAWALCKKGERISKERYIQIMGLAEDLVSIEHMPKEFIAESRTMGE